MASLNNRWCTIKKISDSEVSWNSEAQCHRQGDEVSPATPWEGAQKLHKLSLSAAVVYEQARGSLQLIGGWWCLVRHWLPFPGHAGSPVYKLEKCFSDGNMKPRLRFSSSGYNKTKRRKLSVPLSASSLKGPNFLFTETYTQKDGSRAERCEQKRTHLQLEPGFLIRKFRWEFTAGPPYPGLGSFNNLLAFFISQRELRTFAPGT